MVLRQGSRLAALGIAIGVAVALIATRLMAKISIRRAANRSAYIWHCRDATRWDRSACELHTGNARDARGSDGRVAF